MPPNCDRDILCVLMQMNSKKVAQLHSCAVETDSELTFIEVRWYNQYTVNNEQTD